MNEKTPSSQVPRSVSEVFDRVIASETGDDIQSGNSLRTFAEQAYLDARGLSGAENLNSLREQLKREFNEALAKLEIYARMNWDVGAGSFEY